MLDKESEIFSAAAKALRLKYKKIYVIGTELTSTPPKFPAVSIVQSHSAIRTQYSTFNSLENVTREDYKVEVFSNLEEGKEAQTKEITAVISDVLRALGYERTFCQPIANGDPTIARRVSRYVKNNVI